MPVSAKEIEMKIFIIGNDVKLVKYSLNPVTFQIVLANFTLKINERQV